VPKDPRGEKRHSGEVLKIAAVILFAGVTGLWGYAFLYEPLVQGRWLFVVSVVAVGLLWTALKEAARRKAESVDYPLRQ